jgi:NADH:ubiquinone oxidoreductase subunit D
MAEIRTETMTVNMGPQHPSTHGVLRLVMELDGEVVQNVIPTIGYLHTGIEKTAEQKKWQQVIPLVERMDYLGAACPTRSASRSSWVWRCRSGSGTSACSSPSCSACPAT